MKTLVTVLTLALLLVLANSPALAQQAATPAPLTEEQKEAKEEAEKKALSLLDQIVNESQLLRLGENRVKIQIGVADLLWRSDPERARSLFTLAASAVADMLRTPDAPESRRGQSQSRLGAQLRQELVLTAARHDAQLAYHLLAATRLDVPVDPNNPRRLEMDQNLEQNLLAQVAALDPKLAAQNAEQLLDKNQYPRSMLDVLSQLQNNDKEAALKFEDKLVRKLKAENFVVNNDAGRLATTLVQRGPRLGELTISATDAPVSDSRPLIAQAGYQDLMNALVDAALKATPANSTQRRSTGPRGGTGNQRVVVAGAPTSQEAQNEQRNTMRLASGLRSMLPQIDQYLPSRSAAVRQKLGELGIPEQRRTTTTQATNQQPTTSESLLAAASTAPAGAQLRLYQQAAMRALDEGNPDRARQIANDHLDAGRRDALLRAIDFRQLATKTDAAKVDELRASLATLPSDAARIELLLRVSESTRKQNPEVALDLLNQAREFAGRRATNYEQFEQHLRIATAFSELDSAKSFEILESGILHLNELLSAAVVLSGFEVNVFRDGEMSMQGGNRLNDVVRRYAQEIGRLGRNDFERAQMLASRFQFAEPRIVARMSIARSLMGRENRAMPVNGIGPGPFRVGGGLP